MILKLGSRLALLVLCGAWSVVGLSASRLQAQDEEEQIAEEVEDAKLREDETLKRLIDREPFDQITLDEENKNAVIEVFPMGQQDPKSSRVRITLIILPGRKFDIEKKHIVKIQTYEQLLFAEANRLIAKKEFDQAYEYLSYLLNKGPSSATVAQAFSNYLLENAKHLLAQGDSIDQALAILEELARRDPNFKKQEVLANLSKMADSLIKDYVEKLDFRNARGLIQRLSNQYDAAQIPSLSKWRNDLIARATDNKRKAEQLLGAGEFRKAEQASREMMKVWPSLDGARELGLEIAQKHSVIIVAVNQAARFQDVRRLDNWAARRTGRLAQRTLMEFVGAGPEGGQYECFLGEFELSDNRRQLYLDIDREAQTGSLVTGYDITQRLLDMANPASQRYSSAWGSLVTGASVDRVYDVTIDFRRPHMIPESMLQIPLDPPRSDPDGPSPTDGAYRLESVDENEVRFLTNPRFQFPGTLHPKEIVEKYYADSQDATIALRRRDVDIVDALFPADAAFLKDDPSITVQSYALPTMHFLVPSGKNPFTNSQTFRRAILYGINRQQILEQELLGNETLEGCVVVSGPFPPGLSPTDPLGYAYDTEIQARSYYPRLAVVLKQMGETEVSERAKKRQEEPPELGELTLGYPGNEVAKVASQAIAQYLQVIGITCKLKELPVGTTSDPDGECDLLYVQVSMWEPVVDARRLLAPDGVASISNEYVGMALRRLDAATNWREARTRLHELHRITHEQLSVIPLWQTVDYFAYHDGVQGISRKPVALYQGVEQWKLTPRTPRE